MSIPFAVRVTDLPPEACVGQTKIALGIQRRDTRGDEVLPATYLPDGSAEVRGELRRKEESTPPVFLGPFTFGPPAGRFLYLSWSGVPADGGPRRMFRRIKIPLAGISARLLAELARTPGAELVARIAGTARDGGPACATVALLEQWRVAPAAVSA